MTPNVNARRTIRFVNWAHALDHFALLIFPTAVIAIAADLKADYSDLIRLSTGAFIAFGLFALPVGWLADRFGRRALLSWFFFGYGVSCILVALSTSFLTLAASLLTLGIFSAIYHPIGSSIIVANTTQLGRALGMNGVWGNMGAALASGITGAIAVAFGWRAAFLIPGALLILTGLAFMRYVKEDASASRKKSVSHTISISRTQMIWLLVMFVAALIAGAFTFNIVTIAMPKVIDEKLGYPLPLALTGSITTVIFICGALTQITIGRLIDRFELPTLFIALSVLQPLGLVLAATTTGLPMALGLTVATAAIYGQVVINDAMIGRYVSDELRNRVYSLRFFVAFSLGGFAVPMIANLRGAGGFDMVLLVGGGIGAVVFATALGTWALTRGKLQLAPAPAE